MQNEKSIREDISDIKADIAELSGAADNTWSGCIAAFATYDAKLAQIEERMDLLTEAYKSVVDLVNAFMPEALQNSREHTRRHAKSK